MRHINALISIHIAENINILLLLSHCLHMEATFMQCSHSRPFYIYQKINLGKKKKLQYGNTEMLVL